MNLQNPIAYLETATSSVPQYASSEGNNIMTWIGFKHIMYTGEQAMLEHFRRAGLGMRELFEKYGQVIEIVFSKGRILHALKLDELVTTEVSPAKKRRADCLGFEITMFVERDGKRIKTFAGVLRIVFRRDASLGIVPVTDVPLALAPYMRDQATDPVPQKPADGQAAAAFEAPADAAARFHYTMRIPYFYCHGNERLKMSGYLRIMEHADAAFCEAQGISINRLLQSKRWIPAVPSAEVSILAEAYLEEVLHVVYEVIDVVKDLTYKSMMNCYVVRDGQTVQVATGEIVHAYAEIHSRRDWSMVNFDAAVMQAIGA